MARDEYDDEEEFDEEYDDDQVDDDFGDDRRDDRLDDEPFDPGPRGPGLIERIKALFVTPNARPGEHDVVRSPFVIWLVGGSVALLLIGFVFAFMMMRETAQRQFDAARQQMDEGKYAQAIDLFGKFLSVYPKHKLSEPARIARDQSKILSNIGGASSDWVKGVEEVQNFITNNRDSETFMDYTENLREYAETIAVGAALSAQKTRKPEELEASRQAQKILDRYKSADGLPKEKVAEIRENQEQAEAAIRQKEVFDSGVADVNALIKKGELLSALEQRRILLQQDAAYAAKPEMATLLKQILDAECKTVTSDETARDAETDEAQRTTPPPLSITPQTRSTYTDESDNTLVFAVGADCLYGVDSVTGTPVWRKVIGLNQPFYPVRVNTSVPGLLLFDTNDGELVVRAQSNGDLVWRQPVESAVAGAPLIHENQVYLPTLGRELYRFNLENGRLSGKLTFRQGLLAPPVVTAGGEHLIIAGDKSLIYTVSLRPFECKAAMNLGHAAGSIRSPILRLASLFAVCENDQGNSCNIRILDGGQDGLQLKQAAGARIDGQVHSAAVARGRTLIVPSNPQTLNIFSVSDDPEQETLTPLAVRQLQDVPDAPMYVSAGAAGQMWLFSRSLRMFELKTESVLLKPQQTAIGVATQPIQQIGERFFLGRKPDYGNSVFLTQTDRQELTPSWRVILGNQILASTVAGDSLIAVNDAGVVVKISEQELESGGFARKPSAPPLDLPDNLAVPTAGIATNDERLLFYVGGREPAIWIINKVGQLQQKISIAEAMECRPAVIPGGIVCPLPGKLRLKSLSPGRVDDYRTPQEQDKQIKWAHLLPLDDTQVVAIDSAGQMIKAQFRKSPTAHLAKVSSFNLDSPAMMRPAVSGGKIAVAGSNGKLLIFGAAGFDPIGEIQLPAPATNQLWIVGDRLYVETGRNKLHCFDISDGLQAVWSLAAPSGVAGAPYSAGGATVVALRNGEVLKVDATGNVTEQRIAIGQQLQSGPFQLGQKLLVLSIDGSLHRIESLLAGN